MIAWQRDNAAQLTAYREYYEATGYWPDASLSAPQPTPDNRRILELFDRLRTCAPLGIGPALLAMYHADRDDVALLSVIQTTINERAPHGY